MYMVYMSHDLYSTTNTNWYLGNASLIIGITSLILTTIADARLIQTLFKDGFSDKIKEFKYRLILIAVVILTNIMISIIFRSNKLGIRNIRVYTFGGILYILLMIILILYVDRKKMETSIFIIAIISFMIYLTINGTSRYVMGWNKKNKILYVKKGQHSVNTYHGIFFNFAGKELKITGELDLLTYVIPEDLSHNGIKEEISKYVKEYQGLDNTIVKIPDINELLKKLKIRVEELDKVYNKEKYDNLLKQNYQISYNYIYKGSAVIACSKMRLDDAFAKSIRSHRSKNKIIFPWFLETNSISEYIKKLQEKPNVTKCDLAVLLDAINFALLDINAYSDNTINEEQILQITHEINTVLRKFMLIRFTVDSSPIKIIEVDENNFLHFLHFL